MENDPKMFKQKKSNNNEIKRKEEKYEKRKMCEKKVYPNCDLVSLGGT